MKITIEGIDCTGKNSLSRLIAEDRSMRYFDTDYNKVSVNSFHTDFIRGMIYTEMQMYRSLDNFVKPRYSLTELVYSELYRNLNDAEGKYQDRLEAGCIDDHFLFLILVSEDNYDEYSKLVLRERGKHELMSFEEIDELQKKYTKYFSMSKISNKFAVEWSPIFVDLFMSIKSILDGAK